MYNGNLSKSTQLQTAYIKAVGNQNHALGNYLAGLNGANASMGGYIKSLIGAKAATIGLQVASVALNATITMGISLAISALVTQIQKWANAQEDARKKSVELTNSYKEQQSSLESQIEKYKELKDTLDDGNLSTDEARSIKEQLLEIQQSLIESYGDEASNIDLVNGKYREQLGLLGELSKEKATEYVTENRDVFADAKEALEKERTYNLGTVTSWNTYSPQTEDQKKLLDYIEAYSELLDLTYTGASGRGVTATSVSVSVKADVASADELMHQFATDLEKYGEENDIDVSGILEGISGQLKETWTDELTEYKTVYDEFMKAEIVRNDTLRPLYQESIQAVEDYNKALSTGEGIEEAKANLESVQQSVQSATGELEGSQSVFDGIYEGINKDAEAAYSLGKAFENNKTVQNYAEQLRGLTDVDLKVINFDNTNTEKGEEAFKGLMETLGLTEEQVQSLIDKLVELGYVQGKSSMSDISHKITVSSFTDAWNALDTSEDEKLKNLKSSLLELAETGKLTVEAFNETDGSDEFLKQIGLSAEEAIKKINTLVDTSVQLKSLSTNISTMSDLLTKKNDGNVISASELSGFDAEVRGLESWKEYERLLGDSTSSIEECQNATNALASEWINNGNFLANLTDQNRDYYENQLKNMGIENAHVIVLENLAKAGYELSDAEQAELDKAIQAREEIYALQLQEAQDFIAKKDLKAAAEDAYVGLMQEAEGAGISKVALVDLIAQEQVFNNSGLSVSSKISELSALASAYLGTAAAAQFAANTSVSGMGSDSRYFTPDYVMGQWTSALSNYKVNFDISSSGSSGYKGGSGSSSSNSSAQKDAKKQIDWIKQLLSSLRNDIELTQSEFENLFNIDTPKGLASKISKVTKELNTASKTTNKWKTELGKINISDTLKKQIQSGKKIDLSKYSKSEQKTIKKYQSTWNNYKTSKKNENSLYNQLDNLESQKGKANNLKSQENQYKALAKAYAKAANEYKKYADSVKLSSALKKKVQNGDYNISDYSSKTQELIQKYQEYWDNYQDSLQGKQDSKKNALDKQIERFQLYADNAEAKIEKSNAYLELDAGNYKEQNKHLKAQQKYLKKQYEYLIKIAELNKDDAEVSKLKAEYAKLIAENNKAQFDNIANTYDNKIGFTTSKLEAYQKQIELLEARGEQIGTALYKKQLTLNGFNEDKLEAEYKKLLSQLDTIVANTDDWYDAQDTLFSIEESLVQIQIENENLQNSINQLKFDNFDNLINKLSDITDDTDFLIGLLDSDNLYDDAGQITADGLTAIGMAATAHNTSLAKSKEYQKMLDDLEKMYSVGEISQKEYEELKDTYLQGQREQINAWNDSKDAVIDYVKQGLDAQNEALAEAIDKKKELLDTEKELYDFQNKIKDQNKDIARLERQIAVLEGDDSEENRKKLRELKSQLEDARKEQQDTLYDKSIDDQKEALDKMLTDSQEKAEEYLKDSDKVFSDAILYINNNTEKVSANIQKIAKETGYNISTYITNAWSNSSNAVTTYYDTLSYASSGIVGQIELITNAWTLQANEAERAAQAIVKAQTTNHKEQTAVGAEQYEKVGTDTKALAEWTNTAVGQLTPITRNHIVGDITSSLSRLPSLDLILPKLQQSTSNNRSIDIQINTNIEGVATNEIVKDFEKVARVQAEDVIAKINRGTFARGVRH